MKSAVFVLLICCYYAHTSKSADPGEIYSNTRKTVQDCFLNKKEIDETIISLITRGAVGVGTKNSRNKRQIPYAWPGRPEDHQRVHKEAYNAVKKYCIDDKGVVVETAVGGTIGAFGGVGGFFTGFIAPCAVAIGKKVFE